MNTPPLEPGFRYFTRDGEGLHRITKNLRMAQSWLEGYGWTFCEYNLDWCARFEEITPNPSPWRDIESAPAGEKCLLWIVPKDKGELTFVTAPAEFKPFIFIGELDTWGCLSKATHWMPMPDPPNPN